MWSNWEKRNISKYLRTSFLNCVWAKRQMFAIWWFPWNETVFFLYPEKLSTETWFSLIVEMRNFIWFHFFHLHSELTVETVNCISTWEGVYQFSYEVNFGGGGICNNPNSLLKACQDPGSSYQDNHLFNMNYARCPGVQSSRSDCKYPCFIWLCELLFFSSLLFGKKDYLMV